VRSQLEVAVGKGDRYRGQAKQLRSDCRRLESEVRRLRAEGRRQRAEHQAECGRLFATNADLAEQLVEARAALAAAEATTAVQRELMAAAAGPGGTEGLGQTVVLSFKEDVSGAEVPSVDRCSQPYHCSENSDE
jgi:hypothetical protein